MARLVFSGEAPVLGWQPNLSGVVDARRAPNTTGATQHGCAHYCVAAAGPSAVAGASAARRAGGRVDPSARRSSSPRSGHHGSSRAKDEANTAGLDSTLVGGAGDSAVAGTGAQPGTVEPRALCSALDSSGAHGSSTKLLR